jgi:hypothetical protein
MGEIKNFPPRPTEEDPRLEAALDRLKRAIEERSGKPDGDPDENL